ncbi:hypothetical protein E2C01_054890 [Portunus trituberculatus]|uniref:Uncharacterized protein n=1 Tax=Portunus trituberculatus TaxID=210409 RepID=A0A5B7GPT3_PORTR|nr:hypothetical protein [Portunus trituberculatus]
MKTNRTTPESTGVKVEPAPQANTRSSKVVTDKYHGIGNSDDQDDDLSKESDSEMDEEQDEQVQAPNGNYSNSGRNENNSTQSEWLPVSSKQGMHAFTGKEEKSVTISNADDETEALPIDDDITDTIVQETNRYAQQEIDAATVTRRS